MTDWSNAPEWANFVVTDSNGWRYWVAHNPILNLHGWQFIGRVQLMGRLEWQKSLIERPID